MTDKQRKNYVENVYGILVDRYEKYLGSLSDCELIDLYESEDLIKERDL